MKMTREQWGSATTTPQAMDAPNAQVFAQQVARAGKCLMMPGWQNGLMTGGMVQVLCYDSQGNEAGVRTLRPDERSRIGNGQLIVDPAGYLTVPGPLSGAIPNMSAPAGDSGFLGTFVAAAAVGAAGWWAYLNWSKVEGMLGLKDAPKRERTIVYPLKKSATATRRRRPVDDDEDDDE